MKRLMWMILPLLTAARLPYGPVTVYSDSSAVEPTAGAATINVYGPTEVKTSEKFWVKVKTHIDDAVILNLSGNLFYDSTLVRPTGRIRDNGETVVGSMSNEVAPPGECDVVPGSTNAAIRDISWIASRGKPVHYGPDAEIEFQFMGISAGSAVFGWTPELPACGEGFVADNEFDRYVSNVIWSVEDDSLGTLYYVAAAQDTANYATANATVAVKGSDVTAASLWPNNPSNYETYLRFSPATATVDSGGEVTVQVQVWLPYAIAPNDSVGFSVVYERNKMTLSAIRGINGWGVSPPRDDFSDYADYVQAGVVDTTYTSICGLDSAAVREVWVHPLHQGRKADGGIVDLVFTVARPGNALAQLGCWFANVPGAIDATNFPPFVVNKSAIDRHQGSFPIIERELSPYVWKWRRATSATLDVD